MSRELQYSSLVELVTAYEQQLAIVVEAQRRMEEVGRRLAVALVTPPFKSASGCSPLAASGANRSAVNGNSSVGSSKAHVEPREQLALSLSGATEVSLPPSLPSTITSGRGVDWPQLQTALLAAMKPEKPYTTQDLAQMLGLRASAPTIIRRLCAPLEFVGKLRRVDADGVRWMGLAGTGMRWMRLLPPELTP